MKPNEIKKGLIEYLDLLVKSYERYKRCWNDEIDKPTEDAINSITNALAYINLLETRLQQAKLRINSVYGAKPPTVDSIRILAVNELKKNALLELIERFKDTYKYCSLAHKPDFEQILSTLYSIVYQMEGDNK